MVRRFAARLWWGQVALGLGGCSGSGDPKADRPAMGTVDTGSTVAPVVDADGDGYPAPEDCDDADPAVFPGADDPPYDGVDSDCAGDDDFDADHDGVSRDADCDDADPLRFPGNTELLCDQVDGDCDGEVERAASCAFGEEDALAVLDAPGFDVRLAPDLTGDGLPDLFGLVNVSFQTGHGGSDTDVLQIWGQDADGVAPVATVTSSAELATSYWTEFGVARAMAAGDADGDGMDDLWVTPAGGSALLLLGPITGDVDLDARGLATGAQALLPATDVDGDGTGDLFGWDHVSFGPWHDGGSARTLPIDGQPEAAIDYEGDRAVVGLVAGGFGAWDAETGALLASWKGFFAYPAVAADMNGDGYADFGFVGKVYYGPIVDGREPDPDVVLEDELDRNLEPGVAGDVDGDGAEEIALVESSSTFIVHASTPGTFPVADVSYQLPPGSVSIGPWFNARAEVAIGSYYAPVDLFDLPLWPVE